VGFEPTTPGLQNQSSTIELHWHTLSRQEVILAPKYAFKLAHPAKPQTGKSRFYRFTPADSRKFASEYFWIKTIIIDSENPDIFFPINPVFPCVTYDLKKYGSMTTRGLKPRLRIWRDKRSETNSTAVHKILI
jgi:hypothetical protein